MVMWSSRTDHPPLLRANAWRARVVDAVDAADATDASKAVYSKGAMFTTVALLSDISDIRE